MSGLNIVIPDYEPLPSVRASSQLSSSYVREKHRKKFDHFGKRPGSLSPLLLTYKASEDKEFNGLSIGLIRLQSRGSSFIPEEPLEKHLKSNIPHTFLSRNYNFRNSRRLMNKLEFMRIRKGKRLKDTSIEKYEVISKDHRFAGRNPEHSKVVKGVIPVTMSRSGKRASDNSVKLKICGVMKNFSPRSSLHGMDQILHPFK